MSRSSPHTALARTLAAALAVAALAFLAPLLLLVAVLGGGIPAAAACTALSPPAPDRTKSSALAQVVPTGDGEQPTDIAPLDAKALDAFIAQRRPGSPLAGTGAAFVAAGVASALDPRLLVAIATAESGLGTAGGGARVHNAFGLGPGIAFATWEDGIAAAARTLRRGYLDRSLLTIAQIGPVWAPVGAANDPQDLNQNWVRAVSRIYASLGGDPAAPVVLGEAGVGTCGGATDDGAGAVVAAAERFLGVPYVLGANHGLGPSQMLAGAPDPAAGFDCSSLVGWAYALGAHLYVGSTSQDQWARAGSDPRARRGQGAPPDGWQAADLVFTQPGDGGPGHVALYAGDDRVVVASRPGTVVHVLPLAAEGPVFGWARWLAHDSADGGSDGWLG